MKGEWRVPQKPLGFHEEKWCMTCLLRPMIEMAATYLGGGGGVDGGGWGYTAAHCFLYSSLVPFLPKDSSKDRFILHPSDSFPAFFLFKEERNKFLSLSCFHSLCLSRPLSPILSLIACWTSGFDVLGDRCCANDSCFLFILVCAGTWKWCVCLDKGFLIPYIYIYSNWLILLSSTVNPCKVLVQSL